MLRVRNPVLACRGACVAEVALKRPQLEGAGAEAGHERITGWSADGVVAVGVGERRALRSELVEVGCQRHMWVAVPQRRAEIIHHEVQQVLGSGRRG